MLAAMVPKAVWMMPTLVAPLGSVLQRTDGIVQVVGPDPNHVGGVGRRLSTKVIEKQPHLRAQSSKAGNAGAFGRARARPMA